MNLEIAQSKRLRGTIRVPGDKSISHRAVMLGALAKGDTCIENFLAGEDCLATLRCFKALGVKFSGPTEKGTLIVHGNGPEALQEPAEILNAANSGTTMRLLSGILAGLPFFSVITGDSSLCRRPMGRITLPLKQMGANIWGRQEANLAPLAIQGGRLHGISYSSPVASAQVKSAILLAGLLAAGETQVSEPVPSRDHTERMLRYFGAEVEIKGNTVRLRGKQALTGQKIIVPGDISSAAFLLVAGTILPDSEITIMDVGINPTRSGILEVLEQMGANLTIFNKRDIGPEPVADIQVQTSPLKGITVAGKIIPRLIDEIPVLAVAGALAEGETQIRDAAELKVKESNRIAVIVEELSKFGVKIRELPDGLIIEGGRPLSGTVCNSHGDHRMAMALVVAAMAASGQTLVQNTDCIAVSFPGFVDILNSLRLK